MRVALYLRRSTNEELQADSLVTQEELLRAFAAAHRHSVVSVFRDSASGRSAHRPDFQRLVDAVAHAPTFEGVLVRDVTRWGRYENIDESAYWEFFCLAHGVQVVYIEETFRGDTTPYASLLKVLKRVQAAEFSRDKSRTVQYAKARVVRAGYYPGGAAPYGMKRMVVRPDGTVVQELAPGEHKAIGNYRIKLAPGSTEAVLTVERIFDEFLAGSSRNAIARDLNADCVASPTARGWRYSEVHKILRNPVYAGFAKVRCAPSQNFPDGETILTPNSWPVVVATEKWRAANDLLDLSLWRRTPPGLAEQLRSAFELFGCVDKRMRETIDLPAWETYLRHFDDGHREALALAYADLIATTRERVIRHLKKLLSFSREGDCLVIGNLLRVGFRASFPRMLRGSLYWEFAFNGDEEADVTIGLGFSPPPSVTLLQTFLFHNRRFTPRKRVIHPNLRGRAVNGIWRRSISEIAKSLARHVFRDSGTAKAQFLDEAAKHSILDLPRFAKALGWPHGTAYSIYVALRREGHVLPPLKHAKNKQVDVTCSACGEIRRMTITRALELKTTVCQPCFQRQRGGGPVEVTCPNCGKVRLHWPSTVKRLSNGVNSPCAGCVQRGQLVKSSATRAANTIVRRAAVLCLGERVGELAAERYADVGLSVRRGRMRPSISWRPLKSPTRCALRLICSQRVAMELAHASREEMIYMAKMLLDRRRWRRLRTQAWSVSVDSVWERERETLARLRSHCSR